MMLRISLVSLSLLVASSSAEAGFYLQFADGSWHYISDGMIGTGVLLLGAVIAVGIALSLLASVRKNDGQADYEIEATESAEYYNAQADRFRALKRSLDAEIELTESYINARRSQAQLDELSDVLAHDKTKRRK